MATFTIGQLAEAAGVNLDTVRYYERRGLLAAPPRTTAGYRQFGDDDLARMQLIGRAKGLGFTLTEIAELAGDANGILEAARAKLAAIDEQRAALAEVHTKLERLIDVCADGDADCIALTI